MPKYVEFKGYFSTKEAPKEEYSTESEVNVTYVAIDNGYYRFEEDPSDGYRSHCKFQVYTKKPKGIRFSLETYPILVEMTINEAPPGYQAPFKGIALFGIKTKELI